MYAFCVMLNACVLSHVLYMSFACLLSKESNKQKNSKFPSFAECQHWAKKSLPSARGVALGKAGKKCCKNSHFPSFAECHSLALGKEVNFAECHSLALGKEVNFAECQMVPLGKDYF